MGRGVGLHPDGDQPREAVRHQPECGSFLDPALLSLNDRAFTDPSAEVLGALYADHGIRWLFADTTIADSAALGQFADLRERVGDFAIYELRRP